MLKWSVSSVSTISHHQNSGVIVDSCIELSEKEEKNRDTDEMLEGREAEDENGAKEVEENEGEEEDASQLPAFRRRNYLVGGDSHLST